MTDYNFGNTYSTPQLIADVSAAGLWAGSYLIEPEKRWEANPGWDTALRGEVFAEKSWEDLSNFGVGASLAVPVGYLLGQDASAREHIIFAETHLYNAAILSILKRAIGRERPNKTEFVSFPSQHASTSFASFTYILMMNSQNGTGSSWAGWTAVSLTGFGAVTASLGRVGAGEHHFTDIAVGALLGSGIAALTYSLHDHSDKKNDTASTSAPLVLQFQGSF